MFEIGSECPNIERVVLLKTDINVFLTTSKRYVNVYW